MADLAVGAQNTKLSAPFPPSATPEGDVSDFLLSPDGRRVVYRASQDVYDEIELFALDVARPRSIVQLNPPFAPGVGINPTGAFAISPDGEQCAVWLQGKLFLAPLDGSSSPRSLGRIRSPLDIAFTPDSRLVVVGVCTYGLSDHDENGDAAQLQVSPRAPSSSSGTRAKPAGVRPKLARPWDSERTVVA